MIYKSFHNIRDRNDKKKKEEKGKEKEENRTECILQIIFFY